MLCRMHLYNVTGPINDDFKMTVKLFPHTEFDATRTTYVEVSNNNIRFNHARIVKKVPGSSAENPIVIDGSPEYANHGT